MRSIALAIALLWTLTACASGSGSDQASASADGAAFLTVPLADVRTGEGFTLGGFPGKVTFFIAMAVW